MSAPPTKANIVSAVRMAARMISSKVGSFRTSRARECECSERSTTHASATHTSGRPHSRPRPATEEVPPNAIPGAQEKQRPEDDLARMEQRMFLQLLVARRGLAVSFRWIDHPSTGDALLLVRQSRDP